MVVESCEAVNVGLALEYIWTYLRKEIYSRRWLLKIFVKEYVGREVEGGDLVVLNYFLLEFPKPCHLLPCVRRCSHIRGFWY